MESGAAFIRTITFIALGRCKVATSYCRCGPKMDLATARKEPAPSGWQAREVWVCSNCNKISHAVQGAVSVVRGPQGAVALVHSHAHLNGQRTLHWRVAPDRREVQTVEFRTYPRRYDGVETEPLIFKTWELLMSKLPAFMDAEPDPWSPEATKAHDRAKFEARGIAQTLAILMQPFMADADAVVKAAVKKYKDPDYEVPGLGEHLWDPMKNPDGTWRTPIAETRAKSKPRAKPKAAPAKATKKVGDLSEDEREAIKSAIESGLFTKEQVMPMFDVSIATIELVLKG